MLGADIISTWIDEAGEGESGCMAELWERIIAEVSRSQSLLFYAKPDDFPLKGALVEVGAALALGKPVVACLPGVELETSRTGDAILSPGRLVAESPARQAGG